MLITNLILGIIVLILMIITGGVLEIDRTLKSMEWKRTKGIYDGLKIRGKKHEDNNK